MRKLFCILSVFTLLSTFTLTTSCKKDKETPEGTDNPVIDEKYLGKWTVQPSGSLLVSLELLKNGDFVAVLSPDEGGRLNVPANTILVPSAGISSAEHLKTSGLSPVHYGTFRMEGNKIILSGFGVLDDIVITEDEFHFSLTITQIQNTNTYVAVKDAPAISESDRTNLLCQTWKISSARLSPGLTEDEIDLLWYSIGVEPTESNLTNLYANTTVLFSRAGTYLSVTGSFSYLSEWKWKNKEESAIYYSHTNWTEEEFESAKVENLTQKSMSLKSRYIEYTLSR